MKHYAANEEVKTEEVNETAPEKKVQPEVSTEVKNEKVEETKAEQKPTDLKSLFGLDDVEAIRKRIELGAKYEELESTHRMVADELNGYKEFVDKAINPSSYFSSEDDMYVQNAKMKYPKLPYAAAEKLIQVEAKDISALDALVLNEMVQHADVGLSMDEAESLVLDNLGMTKEDLSEMEEGSLEHKKMQTRAKLARQQLASVQAEVRSKPEAQTVVDFLEKRKGEVQESQETIKKAWEGKMADVVGAIKNLTIKDEAGDVYTFEVPESFIKDMESVLMDNVVARGLQPDEKGLQEVKQNLQAYFWRDNAPKVLRAFEEDIRSKIQVEMDEKYGTQKPSNLSKDVAVTQEDKNSFESMKPTRRRIVI